MNFVFDKLKSKNQHIKQFTLAPNAKAGVLITNIQKKADHHNISKPHRDDHYLLLFAFEGSFFFKIDFEDVKLMAPFILKIEPNQVHQLVESKNVDGWAIGIEEFILESEFQTYLETKWTSPISLKNKENIEHFNTILELGNQLQITSGDIYTSKSILFLINSLLCLIIKETEKDKGKISTKEKRGYIIEQEFKKLLKVNFKKWKSPSQYASELSISVSHLNDTIKELTQSSVSNHIQNISILEAKRLLYFTDSSVKEIGYEVGYEDPVYFGKLFKKITSFTPLQFRKQFRN
ncbi:helix-turn-helix domain-containing protein [Autumnicola musiva]|uniref:AraC family transcriptional regulator n=1 Tax=Autumnicola musiva TaxID=3075589 RepID=A0ABU3DAT4_9FLAO|nr:AraC family transcriptional regulator [Zunongwangia sp. F117]MDT0678646.1 AraC family transcriptional regulator [Zunongwangia sp. F117]